MDQIPTKIQRIHLKNGFYVPCTMYCLEQQTLQHHEANEEEVKSENERKGFWLRLFSVKKLIPLKYPE